MIRKMRGGISQIIVATLLTPIMIIFMLNFTMSIYHIYVRGNVNQIAQECLNDIAKLGFVTEGMNSQYIKEIDRYKPMLKDYSLKYIFSQYNEYTQKFEPVIYMEDGVDKEKLKLLDRSNVTKVKVVISQNELSSLQKIQNIITSDIGDTRIFIEKSIVINKENLEGEVYENK